MVHNTMGNTWLGTVTVRSSQETKGYIRNWLSTDLGYNQNHSPVPKVVSGKVLSFSGNNFKYRTVKRVFTLGSNQELQWRTSIDRRVEVAVTLRHPHDRLRCCLWHTLSEFISSHLLVGNAPTG
jgi:hypothetical protein